MMNVTLFTQRVFYERLDNPSSKDDWRNHAHATVTNAFYDQSENSIGKKKEDVISNIIFCSNFAIELQKMFERKKFWGLYFLITDKNYDAMFLMFRNLNLHVKQLDRKRIKKTISKILQNFGFLWRR
jgi:hypothetical protein